MKRTLSVLMAFLVFTLAASAQTEKGSWLVGGNVELNTAEDDTQIDFSPNAGYFLLDNLAVGARVGLNYRKQETTKTTSLGFGPFARYYFGTTNIRPFGQADVNFTSNKTKTTTTDNSYNGTQWFVGAGLAAFINRNVAIEGLAGYRHTAIEKQNGTGGFNLRIGFQVYLSGAQVESITK